MEWSNSDTGPIINNFYGPTTIYNICDTNQNNVYMSQSNSVPSNPMDVNPQYNYKGYNNITLFPSGCMKSNNGKTPHDMPSSFFCNSAIDSNDITPNVRHQIDKAVINVAQNIGACIIPSQFEMYCGKTLSCDICNPLQLSELRITDESNQAIKDIPNRNDSNMLTERILYSIQKSLASLNTPDKPTNNTTISVEHPANIEQNTNIVITDSSTHRKTKTTSRKVPYNSSKKKTVSLVKSPLQTDIKLPYETPNVEKKSKLPKSIKTPVTGHFYSTKIREILVNWVITHQDKPYCSKEEKQKLIKLTGLNKKQITMWLINYRRRYAKKK